jgi:hypothetical protein
MVEFVVLNLILIPLMLYGIFLMDAAYLKLDLQETVVSGVWDYSQRNTEPPAGGQLSLDAPNPRSANNGLEMQATTKALRVAYSDHTSAFEDGAEVGWPGYGDTNRLRGNGAGGASGHMKHHTGFGAQYTFRFKEAPDDEEESNDHNSEVGGDLDTQLRCGISEDLNWTGSQPMKAFGTSGYNAGGQVRCKAIGFIYNYIIPEKFLNDSFSKEKMSLMTRRRDTTADGAHKYQGQGGRIANIVAEETSSLSFNTWALRNGAHQGDYDTNSYGAKKWTNYTGKLDKADIGKRPGLLGSLPLGGGPGPRENPFYKRVQYLYTSAGALGGSYESVRGKAASFAGKAEELKLIKAYGEHALSGGSIQGLPNISGVFLTARYQPGSPGVRQPKPPLFPVGPGAGGNEGFLSTPYDGPNNNYPSAAGARGEFYMGCNSEEMPNCF